MKYIKTLIIAFVVIYAISTGLSLFGVFTGFYPIIMFFVFLIIYTIYKIISLIINLYKKIVISEN